MRHYNIDVSIPTSLSVLGFNGKMPTEVVLKILRRQLFLLTTSIDFQLNTLQCDLQCFLASVTVEHLKSTLFWYYRIGTVGQ